MTSTAPNFLKLNGKYATKEQILAQNNIEQIFRSLYPSAPKVIEYTKPFTINSIGITIEEKVR